MSTSETFATVGRGGAAPSNGARGVTGSDALVDALRRPTAYPFAVDEVDLHETHISWVFVAGERVYKVKKPVDFGFLDFSTFEKRRHFCEEEVRLNRRLAPELYLGVVPIVRDEDGGLHVGGDEREGTLVEHAVEMARLPQAGMLDRRLAEGKIDNALIDELAERLAVFHREAARGDDIAYHGTFEAVRDAVVANLGQLRRFVGDVQASLGGVADVGGPVSVMSAELFSFLRARARTFLAAHRRLFDQRVRRGRVCEGHGDLHAANVCVTDDGAVIYDCIEFSQALRCNDVANDLAFLAMDLDVHGFRAFSALLVRQYALASGDRSIGWLLDFYKGYRALVRAKVACLSAGTEPGDVDATTRARKHREALRYVHLAASYELPPSLVFTTGLPGTGKSWFARRIADAFGAVVVRSDEVRKRLAGVAPSQGAAAQPGQGLYSDAHGDQVYAVMARRAIDQLSRGRSVVLDATFSSRERRARLVDVATRMGFPVVCAHVHCDAEVVEQRMRERAHEVREASDADWELYRWARERYEPPDELRDRHRVDYRSGAAVEGSVSAAIDRFLIQIEDGVGA